VRKSCDGDHEEETDMRGPIVVGTDGSETSRLAIGEAATLARGSGSPIIVLFVRHAPLAGLGALSSGGQAVGVLAECQSSDQALAEAQSIAILEPMGLSWRFAVGSGDPASELIRVATESGSDTIVVAGRRHGAIGGYLAGSVATKLVHQWGGSLLIIHPRAEDGSPLRGPAVV
jgi:nucleotide-binding universal stress UspA family protein